MQVLGRTSGYQGVLGRFIQSRARTKTDSIHCRVSSAQSINQSDNGCCDGGLASTSTRTITVKATPICQDHRHQQQQQQYQSMSEASLSLPIPNAQYPIPVPGPNAKVKAKCQSLISPSPSQCQCQCQSPSTDPASPATLLRIPETEKRQMFICVSLYTIFYFHPYHSFIFTNN